MSDLFSTDNLMLLFQLLYVVTAIGVIIVIVTENRNPVKTISWVLVLMFLPLVGLIIYYFFGEDGRKQRLISHKIFKKLKKISLNYKENGEHIAAPNEYKGLVDLLQHLNGSILYGGNKVTFYSDGKSKFDVLIEELRKARHYIHIQYYIYMDDNIGRQIRDVLVEKVKQGVTVRFIYDDVGSWKSKRKFFDDMREKGIETQAFLKVAFRYLAGRVNYRNHRKIVVIDGQVGFMGGMNVADRYIDGLKFGVWRDSHIKIEGKAVAGLQASFIIDWYYSRKEFLSSDLYFPEVEDQGDNLMQFITGGPIGRFKGLHLGVLQAIFEAKKLIYIQTPYFVPTEALLLAIQTASMRGVEVRLMVPRHSDTTFVHIATKSFLKEVLDAEVKVYFFEAGFLHSKMMIIDDNMIVTGSANMDVRSFEHNFEINAYIYNEKSCAEAKQIFYNDMKQSTLLSPEVWEERSRIDKITESVVRLFSPLL